MFRPAWDSDQSWRPAPDQAPQAALFTQTQGGILADRGREGLTPITCYPFDALIPGGPLRFVVFAESR
jgi:hypothetical protein